MSRVRVTVEPELALFTSLSSSTTQHTDAYTQAPIDLDTSLPRTEIIEARVGDLSSSYAEFEGKSR